MILKTVNKHTSCVYAWMRGGVCLYVGRSSNLGARLVTHHVISKANWQSGDTIQVWNVPKENLRGVEKYIIRRLQPCFNTLMFRKDNFGNYGFSEIEP